MAKNSDDFSSFCPIMLGNIGFLSAKLANLIADSFAEFTSKYELTPRHCGVLFIASSGKYSQKEIALMLNADKNILVQIIDYLESLNLLKRVKNPQNRKENIIELSKKGKELSKVLQEKMLSNQQNQLSFLPQKRYLELISILQEIHLHNIKKGEE